MTVAKFAAGIGVFVLALVACAQNATDSPSPTPTRRATPPPASAPLAAVRVILKFNPPAPIQNATLLRALEAQAKSQVKYIASIAADTHVYLFSPTAGTTTAQVLQRISAMKEVAHVELDEKTQAH
jgi:hypothetical protein